MDSAPVAIPAGLSPPEETARRRAVRMRAGLDVAGLRGAEIGPLARPVVAKSDGAVTYVDHLSTEALRAAYADNPMVDAAAIVPVDAVWGERTLSECLGGERVDYVMASHVAEHVPDLLGWLVEVQGVLRPGGQLRLALPDPRFSSDALRGETRLSDVLTAFVLRARRPSVFHVLDFRLHTTDAIDARTIYDGSAEVTQAAPAHTLAEALAAAGWARDMPQHYFDVHCWVLRPLSFARLMQRLAALGLLRLACAGMVDTEPHMWEYCAFLTPCDDAAEAARSWLAVQPGLRDPLPGSGAARREAQSTATRDAQAAFRRAADADRMALRGALAAAQTALAATRAELEAARAGRAAAEAQVAGLRGSLSWRLTAPLRRVRARLG